MHLKNGCDFSASPRVSGGIMARAQEVDILNILSVIINSAHGQGESGPQGSPHYHGSITGMQGLEHSPKGTTGTCAKGLLEFRTAEGKCGLAFLTSAHLLRPTQLHGNRGQASLPCSSLCPGQLRPLFHVCLPVPTCSQHSPSEKQKTEMKHQEFSLDMEGAPASTWWAPMWETCCWGFHCGPALDPSGHCPKAASWPDTGTRSSVVYFMLTGCGLDLRQKEGS